MKRRQTRNPYISPTECGRGRLFSFGLGLNFACVQMLFALRLCFLVQDFCFFAFDDLCN